MYETLLDTFRKRRLHFLILFCNTSRKKCNFFESCQVMTKESYFFFLFSRPFNCALFQLFPIYNTYFFLKVKCRISSKSLHKWDIFNLRKHILVGDYGLVFGALFEPLGNHNTLQIQGVPSIGAHF